MTKLENGNSKKMYIVFKSNDGSQEELEIKDWSKWFKLYRIVRDELDE